MKYRVRYNALAVEDLIALHQWIEAEATAEIADAYLDEIERRCSSLADFPERGTPRDAFGVGVRTLPFRKRIILAYRIDGEVVRVLRVVNGARLLGLDLFVRPGMESGRASDD